MAREGGGKPNPYLNNIHTYYKIRNDIKIFVAKLIKFLLSRPNQKITRFSLKLPNKKIMVTLF